MRRIIFLLVLVVLVPMRSRAQDARNTEPNPHISPAIGVHYGSPMRISLAGGLLADMSQHRNDGVVVAVEVG